MSILKTLTINGTTYNVTPVVPTSSVTLLATAWEGDGEVYSQVVEIPGVTASTRVDLQPTSEQLAEFHHKDLAFVTENDGGTVTVFAIGEKPKSDHTIQITKTEVKGTGKIRGNTVGTTIAPEKVLVKSENLTPEEKAQARANIGAAKEGESGGSSLLVVTLSDSRKVASNTSEQIYDHVQNGGVVVLDRSDADHPPSYVPLTFSSNGLAEFGGVSDDYTGEVYRINPNATVEITSLTFTASLITDDLTAEVNQLNKKVKVYDFEIVPDVRTPNGEAVWRCSTGKTASDMVEEVHSNAAIIYGCFLIDGSIEYYLQFIVNGTNPFFGRVFCPVTIDGNEYWTDEQSEYDYYYEELYALKTQSRNQQAQIDALAESTHYKNLYGRVEITADDIAAAGDEGITCLTIGSNEVDLSQYDDILIRLYVPANEELNPETGALRIHATQTANFVQESRNELLKAQSLGISTVCGVQKSANTPFAIKMMFAGDTFLYGQVMRNGYSNAHGYAGAMNTWTSISEHVIKSQKKYFHISAYCLTNKVKFKFPAGSYMEVYGR